MFNISQIVGTTAKCGDDINIGNPCALKTLTDMLSKGAACKCGIAGSLIFSQVQGMRTGVVAPQLGSALHENVDIVEEQRRRDCCQIQHAEGYERRRLACQLALAHVDHLAFS